MPKFHLKEMMPLMEEMLSADGEVTFIPEGTSMLPCIVGGKDSVTIKKPEGRLKKYDACLYGRKNGDFVLHRVVKVLNNWYTLSGDNQYILEEGIEHSQIIGLVISVNKKGKEISCQSGAYKFYVWVHCCPFSKFLKKTWARVRNRLSKIKNILFGEKNED